MRSTKHLVLCGDVADRHVAGARVRLNLHGASPNVHLKIADISKRLLANIPAALVDLLEVACYIYAADGAISRGGRVDLQMGTRWRRKLQFVIPVRRPELWSSAPVSSTLVETLGFLSDDEYEFDFRPLGNPPLMDTYFEFPEVATTSFSPDEVMLFSGGLDSLAGAVELLAAGGTRLALVSHRSASKITSAQRLLVDQLRSRFGVNRVLHVPVWANVDGSIGHESTHRTRSFLYAALGAVTARLFRRKRICFFENGVTSLNLPPVAQVVGARATRTTHPQALAGFRRVLSNIFDQKFDIDNRFIWKTKSEVLERISANACGDLIKHTVSCTRVRDMTKLNPHCGECSQCIDRRFAILAAGQGAVDPAEAYRTRLFEDARPPGPDREMALAIVRSASAINRMTDIAFFANYGETSRVVDFFSEPADAVAGRIFDLHQRHAAAVCRVMEAAISSHAANLREGSLPPDCLLSLLISQREGGSIYPATTGVSGQAGIVGREVMIAIDAERGRVLVNRWGELGGVSAALIIALSKPFRRAAHDELAPEHYPFIKSAVLAHQTSCDSAQTLRQRIVNCRNGITKLATEAGASPPSLDTVIENVPWRGYRLNPDWVRVVTNSELADGG